MLYGHTHLSRSVLLGALLAVLGASGCTEEARPFFLGGTLGLPGGSSQSADGLLEGVSTGRFTEVPIQGRTFTVGRAVTTETFRATDLARTPLMIDFNGDGRVDPVVAYEHDPDIGGIIQILLSYGEESAVGLASLTLDGGDNTWEALQDVAVGDIDGDGSLDIIGAAAEGVVYLRHPSDATHTHILREWGHDDGALELIEGTGEQLSAEELESLIATALGPTFDVSYYIVTVTQGYTAVEIADFDNDGDNDIIASREQEVSLDPKPSYELEPVSIVGGSIQLLINPGFASTGEFWTAIAIGQHERHSELDRKGARDLRVCDLDGDGDLDVISAAMRDNNAQVAWFRNPGGPGPIDIGVPWTQYRIGSVRGAAQLDLADVTGDGRLDVVATAPTQMQMMLFVQPEESASRGYDWYSAPIVTFESYEPRAVKALDIDNDGVVELIVGGTEGAVRYFERPTDPTSEWLGNILLTFESGGDVGLLGYGDMDGDGDLDLVCVVATTFDDASDSNRVSWIRNELIR